MRRRDEDDAWRGPGCNRGSSPASAVEQALDELGALSLATLRDDDVADLLDRLTRATGRLTAAVGRVAAEADRRRLGDRAGARNTASWWSHRSRMTRGETSRALGLGRDLERDLHAPVAEALGSGRLLADQARVIVHAVDALPDDLPDATTRSRARDQLLALAADHDAHRLRILGRRILDIVAPEVAEQHEQRALEAEEQAAAAAARFTIVDDGHGQCHGRFTLPTFHGQLLREQLHAFANPRRHPDVSVGDDARPGDAVVTPTTLGHALMEYVERYPADRVPRHGTTTSLTVTLDLETLVTGLGAATLASGHRISAGEARRLACDAGVLPAVLGGPSEVLDLGRGRRLFSPAQRRALGLRDGGCTAEGCGLPPSVCHAHHDEPWVRGGRTDLDNGRLLCPRHHRLAHDRRYELRPGPGRTVAFHRRT